MPNTANSCSNNFMTSWNKKDFAASLEALLIPDAQGCIHTEELRYAFLSFLLNQESPSAARRYQEEFDRLIGSGEPPLDSGSTSDIALSRVIRAGILQPESKTAISELCCAVFDQHGFFKKTRDGLCSLPDFIQLTEASLQIDHALKRI